MCEKLAAVSFDSLMMMLAAAENVKAKSFCNFINSHAQCMPTTSEPRARPRDRRIERGHFRIMLLIHTMHSSSLTAPVISGLAFIGVLLLQVFFTRRSTSSLLSDEARRRLQHLTSGQALIVVSYMLPLHYCQALLLFACILIIYIRFLHDAWYRQQFHSLLRPYELQYGVLPGAFYFLVGVLIVATCISLDDCTI